MIARSRSHPLRDLMHYSPMMKAIAYRYTP